MDLRTPLFAAALGWVAGMRTMTAPAVTSRHLARAPRRPHLVQRPWPSRALAKPSVSFLLTAAALGEFVGDKLPMTPARTRPEALSGRLASGALVGAVLAQRRGTAVVPAVLAGGAAAVASSFVMMNARAAVRRALGSPDLPVALAEDVLAVALGQSMARSALD